MEPCVGCGVESSGVRCQRAHRLCGDRSLADRESWPQLNRSAQKFLRAASIAIRRRDHARVVEERGVSDICPQRFACPRTRLLETAVAIKCPGEEIGGLQGWTSLVSGPRLGKR